MAGVWKRDGTVAVTNGNKKVTGTGTTFADAKNGVAKGHLFCMTTGATVDLYEVDYVVSNTEIYLVQAFRGVTATGKAYEIINTFSDSIPEFARKLNASLAYYQGQSDMVQKLYTSDAAEITVIAPDGTTHKLIPWKRVTSEGEGQAARAKTEADRSKTEADRAVSEADRAAGIVAAAALPVPDVWAPLTDSLRLFTGYGREVKVGDDVVARMLTFSRSTTKTHINRDGVLATAAVNEPTFDQWGIQLDGQSQNLIPSSEASVFAAANSGFQTITSGVSGVLPVVGQRIAFAPNAGETNATLVQFSQILQGGQTYTFSCFMKVEQGPSVQIPENSLGVYSTATTSTISRNVVRDLGNGVYRVALTFLVGGAGSQQAYLRFSRGGAASESWVGVVGGCQVENLQVASAYIPTNGAAFTRSADLLTLQNPLNIPVKAGDMTVAMEVRRNPGIPTTSFPRIFHIGGYTWLVGDSTRFAMRGGTTDQGQVLKSAPGVIETVVYRIKGNEITVRCGSLSATITRIGVPEANLSTTFIGSDPVAAQNLFGHVRNLRVWRRALTDDQMKAIA